MHGLHRERLTLPPLRTPAGSHRIPGSRHTGSCRAVTDYRCGGGDVLGDAALTFMGVFERVESESRGRRRAWRYPN